MTPEIAGLDEYPAYVRMVARPSVWKKAKDEGDIAAATSLFIDDRHDSTSLYYVKNNTDLRRVAVGLNAIRSPDRPSKPQRAIFLPVLTRDLKTAGIAPSKTQGGTRCEFANSVHFDIELTQEDAERLIQPMLRRSVPLARYNPTKMRSAIEKSKTDGCPAVTDREESCECGMTP